MPESTLGELKRVLESNLLMNAGVLGMLARSEPAVLAVESLEPLCALLAFGPHRQGLPATAFLWGRYPAPCRRLLDGLGAGKAFWLTAADPEAAAAAREWAAQIAWAAEEINHTLSPEDFRPAPHPEVRRLTAWDAPALEGARPHVARALLVPPAPRPPVSQPGSQPARPPVPPPPRPSMPRPGPRRANCFFGVIRGGAWCGDAFCGHLFGDVWAVADVAVAEGCRRAGLGKGLVTACTEYVLAAGGRPTYQANADNQASRRTCGALGYVPVGSSYRFQLTAP